MLSVVNQRMETYDFLNKSEDADALSFISSNIQNGVAVASGEIVVNNADSVDERANNQENNVTEASKESIEIKTKEDKADDSIVIVSSVIEGNNEDSRNVIPEEIKEAESKTIDINAESTDKSMSFPSILHKDSFLIFRALCKLSMKGLHDESGSSQSDPIALQNKILSLELILHMLQQCGPAFKNGERFIYAVRRHLCVSLLGNCTSQVAQVTGLSLQIFVILMQSFKEHLKSELEVFVQNIFLRILESENSTFDHKYRVLEVFHNLCSDASNQVEVFINYDCDYEAIDLFRRIVDGFSKIAKNPSLPQNRSSVDFLSSNKKAEKEEQTIRMKGLEGLVIVLRSLLKSANLDENMDAKNILASATTSPIKSTVNKNQDDDDINDDVDTNINTEGIGINMVDVFDKKQKLQEELETGVLKFNLSTKKGLMYLQTHGHIGSTPKDVAQFFHQYQDRLDKTAIGEYLGREREYQDGFCLKVLHEYVDSMDFAGMIFDGAIRAFLTGFRLPGEAQKIDRLMEKFAERYYLQNRDTFASAEMAFILAFSTIMLQTNLHNPAIRDDKRMTKEQFLKQNKGISADGELPEDMLMEIYDRISAQPISITSDGAKTNKKTRKDDQSLFQSGTDKRRKDAFNHERKEMVRASEAMFRQKMKRGSVFVKNSAPTDEAYVKPMFEVVWAPITGVFSQMLEETDDDETVELCLLGFQYAIRLACRLDCPTARNTFIYTLSKFTTLDTVREMQYKNVECIKILMNVAVTEGDYLEESWNQILQCYSQLSRLQLFSSGLHTDDMFFSNDNSSKSSRRGSLNSQSLESTFTKLFSGPSKAETARVIEEANADLINHEINPSSIDKLYILSKSLSSESVYNFVKCLCDVSMLEISSTSSMNNLRGKEISNDTVVPRVFSLQKLVEVADFNMYSRPRIAWSNIWTLLANHFTSVGVHDNLALSMFAIDSLKQLSIKFLQKIELSNFNFQRVFLKPFEIIMVKSKSLEIKDLVLNCIDIMIKACASNIRSGWRSIFSIFTVAASQDSLDTASLAFDITENLIVNQFELLIYDFVELMNCLVAFSASKHTFLSLKAISYIGICANHLAQGVVSPALDAQNPDNVTNVVEKSKSNNMEIDQESLVFRLWWPLLLGLSTSVGDNRLELRKHSIETLNTVLRECGHLFSSQTWAVIFKGILFPMIDSAKTDITIQPVSSYPTQNPSQSVNNNSWIGTMGEVVLNVLLDLYELFQEKCIEIRLLPEMMGMLEGCVCQDTESLTKLGLNSYKKLLLSLNIDNQGMNLDTSNLVIDRLTSCIRNNLCMDFGSCGYVKFISKTPNYLLDSLKECPLANRKKSKEDVKAPEDVGASVKTSFGIGKITQMMCENIDKNYPTRRRVQLPWGVLYTTETWISKSPAEIEQQAQLVHISPRLNEEQAWKAFCTTTMTSMVTSLYFIDVIKQINKGTNSISWQYEHFSSLFITLEELYWHAISFNNDLALRSRLHQNSFMLFSNLPNQLPHLLEQEINSIYTLILLSYQLYLNQSTFQTKENDVEAIILSDKISNSKKTEEFAYPWVKR
jgi:brefeldin A-inhibited guanine nucleotide-exchange protein